MATLTDVLSSYALQVKPVYDIADYTITIKGGINGTSTLKTNTGKWGATFSYTAPDIDGYTFTGWSDGNTNKTRTFYTCDIVITAEYEVAATPRTITITPTTNGTVTVTDGGSNSITSNGSNNVSMNINDGTELTVTYNPASHYHFASWANGTPTLSNSKFTVSGDATIGATFEEDAKYTVNITTPKNGTISVMNGSTSVSDGNKVYAGTVLTVTATGDTENHYEFKSWKEGTPALTNNQFTLNSDVTIGANFGLEEYTISFYNGENLLSSSSAAYGSTPVQPATPTKIVGDDEYAFEGWSKTQDGAVVANWAENAKVTGNQNYYAKFSSTAVTKYTITVGALTNCKSMTLTCDGNTIEVPAEGGAYKYAVGKEIVVDAIPARGYHFEEWDGDASEDKNEANRLIDGIDDDMTLTPTFAGNTPFPMSDEWEKWNIASAYASYKNKVLDATLTGRQFTVGQWATLSLPFDYTLTEEDGALYKSVYKFNSMEMAGESSVFIDFVRTYDIKANEPYLVVPRGNVNNPTFYGVKQLEDAAEKTLTSDHNVYFVSSLWKQTISGNEYFYVSSNSQLRFAHSLGTTIKANRAFFHIEGSSNAPRRVTIVLDGVEVEKEIAEDGSLEDVQNVRKYMENGRLVIECNGVRMDATGKKIN
ncbi:MAG: InlB B-repeat-containing protein [Paludibacteraceae bacterium]|nr:InlB B-repeat-containing protein [Paludibacteraceae bacterium]